jgi:8-oxo-dGTP pyrophosphatase MutT (NUDIX family)
MYKVFFNDRKILIGSTANRPNIKTAVIIDDLKSIDDVKKWFLDFAVGKNDSVVLLHPRAEEFWETIFLPAFKLVPAAGGVVVRNKKILFIFRNGKWDLPKGKIDKGEQSDAAALREVEEECGIRGHEIVKKIPSTFHIFQSPYKNTFGQWILKETFWYEMSYFGSENGTPQTEENITEIRWFAKNELDIVFENTYENLKQIIEVYRD